MELSEEEILQYLKNKATELKEDISRVEDYVNTGNDEEELDAIQGLLDLYNKQKEEIEYYKSELEKESSIWTKLEKTDNYISKDKIIDKIHEIGSETQYLLTDKGETKQNYAIRKFYELLEEK
jgi:hypothetical protein